MNIFEDTSPHAYRNSPLRVAVLGASGSVGKQTLDVCRHFPDKVEVVALAVHSSVELLFKLQKNFIVITSHLQMNLAKIVMHLCICLTVVKLVLVQRQCSH